MSRIALGTVQFGLDYGINNPRGRVSEDEVFIILREALNNGINVIDTAVSYGLSEEIIGKFIKCDKNKFNIVSKLSECDVFEVEGVVRSSLKKLGIDKFYGYLFHNFKLYIDKPGAWAVLEDMKAKGIIKKIGFSLYYTQDLDRLINDGVKFDLVQVPYSIFDHRFEKYFELLKKRNVEIHARSVFLQGLAFKDPLKLSGFFLRFAEELLVLHKISRENNYPVYGICLNYVLRNKCVDKAVVGVDGIGNFKEVIKAEGSMNELNNFSSELVKVEVRNEELLLPFKWQVDSTRAKR